MGYSSPPLPHPTLLFPYMVLHLYKQLLEIVTLLNSHRLISDEYLQLVPKATVACISLSQATLRFYLAVMEINWEKAWDHCYVTDWKWWTRSVRNVDLVFTNQVYHFWPGSGLGTRLMMCVAISIFTGVWNGYSAYW